MRAADADRQARRRQAARRARRGPARPARVRRAPAAGVRGEDVRRPGPPARSTCPAPSRRAAPRWRRPAAAAGRVRRRDPAPWLAAAPGTATSAPSRSCVAIWAGHQRHRASELLYFWPVWVAGPWGAVLLVTTVSGLAIGEPRKWAAKRGRKKSRRSSRRGHASMPKRSRPATRTPSSTARFGVDACARVHWLDRRTASTPACPPALRRVAGAAAGAGRSHHS